MPLPPPVTSRLSSTRSCASVAGLAALTGGLLLAGCSGPSHPGYVYDEPSTDADADDTGGFVAVDAAGSDGCGSVQLVGRQAGNVLVVFDQSNSMGSAYATGDAGVSRPKYQVARDAVLAALGPLSGTLAVGAIFFPTVATSDVCSLVDTISTAPQIQLEPEPAFATAWTAHFAPPFKTILGTPLAVALQRADTAYVDPSPLTGQRVVVVLTDGAPTCDTVTADILAPVQRMAARGIKTFVVGLPGSTSASTLLDQIAAAGGTGKYLSPADPTALETQLAGIATAAIDRCTFTFDPAPPDPKQVHLLVTDAAHPSPYELPQGTDWALSADGTTATLGGPLCDQAKANAYTSMRFVFGCVSLF